MNFKRIQVTVELKFYSRNSTVASIRFLFESRVNKLSRIKDNSTRFDCGGFALIGRTVCFANFSCPAISPRQKNNKERKVCVNVYSASPYFRVTTFLMPVELFEPVPEDAIRNFRHVALPHQRNRMERLIERYENIRKQSTRNTKLYGSPK